jgi:hypothetical protein
MKFQQVRLTPEVPTTIKPSRAVSVLIQSEHDN